MKWAFLIFSGLYLAALLLLAIGLFGWFGQEQDPLSAVFLMPIGLPWNLLGDRLGIPGTAILVAAPAINAALLFWLWKR